MYEEVYCVDSPSVALACSLFVYLGTIVGLKIGTRNINVKGKEVMFLQLIKGPLMIWFNDNQFILLCTIILLLVYNYSVFYNTNILWKFYI